MTFDPSTQIGFEDRDQQVGQDPIDEPVDSRGRVAYQIATAPKRCRERVNVASRVFFYRSPGKPTGPLQMKSVLHSRSTNPPHEGA